jgi:hypothetical protein
MSAVPAHRAPALLQIVVERVRSDSIDEYGRIEEQLLAACRRLGAPNTYLALVTVDQPTEVWWFTMYESQADVDRVVNAYEQNVPLTSKLRELGALKSGMAETASDHLTSFRQDLSGQQDWKVGELEYVVIQEQRSPSNSPGMVFQRPDGTTFIVHAAASLQSAREISRVAGAGARLFRVEPTWSLPKASWMSANPSLWEP